MNCIESGKIQAYIDGECTTEESVLFAKHFSTCSKCAAELGHQKKVATNIKKAMGQLVKETVEIPAFIAPVSSPKKGFIRRRKFVYGVVAACAILFAFLLIYDKEEKKEESVTVFMSLGPEVDANRPFADQDMQINLIDSKGNVTELSLK